MGKGFTASQQGKKLWWDLQGGSSRVSRNRCPYRTVITSGMILGKVSRTLPYVCIMDKKPASLRELAEFTGANTHSFTPKVPS